MFNPDTLLIPVEIEVNDLSWLPTALQFARRVTADVYFLYVNDPQAGYRHPTLDEEDLEKTVRAAVDAKEFKGLKVEFATTKGSVRSRVREFCDEKQIDMIVAGHKHHPRIYGSLFDTTDEEIIDAVKIPVLVIPK